MNEITVKLIYDELEKQVEGFENKTILFPYPDSTKSNLLKAIVENTKHTMVANVSSKLFVPGNTGLSQFGDNVFDLTLCQYSGYPETDFDFFSSEVFRTLKPNGHYIGDEFGWEEEHFRRVGFVDLKRICRDILFYARKP